jgi:8-oxo-dGTP pyrophosphatase MutT (NUDIX family)
VKWTEHGRRTVYTSPWVEVQLADVEIPGGSRFDHHVLAMPRTSNTAVVTDEQDRVLLLYRHRFISGRWGWEVPGGWGDPGEEPIDTIRREIEEETGWRPGAVSVMTHYYAMTGISDAHFTVFHATGSVRIGEREDTSESSRVEWVPLDVVRKLAAEGEITDGPSLAAISYFLGIYRAAA